MLWTKSEINLLCSLFTLILFFFRLTTASQPQLTHKSRVTCKATHISCPFFLTCSFILCFCQPTLPLTHFSRRVVPTSSFQYLISFRSVVCQQSSKWRLNTSSLSSFLFSPQTLETLSHHASILDFASADSAEQVDVWKLDNITTQQHPK